MNEIWNTITSVEFWIGLLQQFRHLGPLAPMILSAIESIIPPLPLVAIVAVNVAAHGAILGFLYSWIGTCVGCTVVFLFFRHVLRNWFLRFSDRHPKVMKARKWVEKTNVATLFVLALLPFTPSAFLNFAFGVSEYPRRKYLITIFAAKLIMIGLLAFIGQGVATAYKNPWTLVASIVVLIATYFISKIVTQRKIDNVNKGLSETEQ